MFLTLFNQGSLAQKEVIYFFPGLGSDERVFSELELDSSCYEFRHIKYHVPYEESMVDYARNLANQIQDTGVYHFIGVSFGGMVAVEMTELLNPDETIIISSCRNNREVPPRYHRLLKMGAYNTIPASWYKKYAPAAQGIVEPDRRKFKALCLDMLDKKDPDFLRNASRLIASWDRKLSVKGVRHIHGSNDRTIPVRHVHANHYVGKGSHMMILTRAKEISEIIKYELGS